MRKKKKEQIISLLQCYREAHSAIRKGIEEGRGEEAISLLVLCQEGMEKIERDTEQEPCGKTEREALFSSYQEALYSCYLSLIKTEEENAEPGTSCLDRAEAYFSKIEEEIASIPVKTLHLFLPYKASMWDSMESVYFAALQDSSCEALVMPITYYEKEDGKFGKRINERAEFPSEIETIDEGFSLEEAQPDVIYIHNPYDDKNILTSVDPRYYSFHLKDYTENLVYIPYYTTMGKAGFGSLFMPAYRYVHHIVVQSEEHKQRLPKEVQEKARILGSPKLDRALAYSQNPPKIPEDWKRIARGRKIYYYNTVIEEMLGNPESFLQKMEEVFSLFKENPKYCLLWRPHPLLESSFFSVDTAYRKRFLELKLRYLTEEIGIYDSSAEPERAVALSSVYLGDETSSMAALFLAGGKPLFILDSTVSEERRQEERNQGERNREKRLTAYFLRLFRRMKRQSFALSGKKESEEALVYEGRFLLMGQLEGDRLRIRRLALSEWGIPEQESMSVSAREYMPVPADEYGEAYFYEGRWILTPRAGNHFLILEKGKEPKKLPLPEGGCKPDAFSGSYRGGEYLFCKAENYPFDIRFSLKTHGIKELKEGILHEEEGREVFLEKGEEIEHVEFLFPAEELISGFLPWRSFSYGLQETVLYSLSDYLEERPLSYAFNKDYSKRKLEELSVHVGSSGKAIYAFFQAMLNGKEE
ncbi:hypothetical protein [Oribacterium asaccharolyticum]|uniref:hypothetical protein n=1 Tax=Oribacterium asaccharolyticum TaxID=1501332 RepID=UPI0028EC0CB3|nr:hypothetical protein [Oribacterium asaccharolyticum]